MRPIGVVEQGMAGDLEVVTGRLNVGEALAPPLIRAVRTRASRDRLVLIDAPPGTSCSMIAAVHGADLVVLVTEPTPFGLNDLALAVEAVRTLQLPFGVVINRVGSGDRRVHDYCAAEGLEILAEIPDDRRIAETYARGGLLVEELHHTRPVFESLAQRIEDRLVRDRQSMGKEVGSRLIALCPVLRRRCCDADLREVMTAPTPEALWPLTPARFWSPSSW